MAVALIIGETVSDEVAFFVNLLLSFVYIAMACVSSWLYTKRSDAIIRAAFTSAKTKSILKRRVKKEKRDAKRAARTKAIEAAKQQQQPSDPLNDSAQQQTNASIMTARSSNHAVSSSNGSDPLASNATLALAMAQQSSAGMAPLMSSSARNNEISDEGANSSFVPKRSARQAYQSKRLSNTAINQGYQQKRQSSTLQRHGSSLAGTPSTYAPMAVGVVGSPVSVTTGNRGIIGGASFFAQSTSSGVSMPVIEGTVPSSLPPMTPGRHSLTQRLSSSSRRKHMTEEEISALCGESSTTVAAMYTGPRRMASGLAGQGTDSNAQSTDDLQQSRDSSEKAGNSVRSRRAASQRPGVGGIAAYLRGDAPNAVAINSDEDRDQGADDRFQMADEEQVSLGEWCVAANFDLGYPSGVHSKFLVKPQSIAGDNIGRFFLFLVVFLVSRAVTNLVLVVLQKHDLYYGDDAEIRAQQDMLQTLPTYLYFMMPLVLLYMFANMLERADSAKSRPKRVVKALFCIINLVFWGLFTLYQVGAIDIEKMESRSVGISLTYVFCYSFAFFYFPKQFAQFGEVAVKEVIKRVQESCLVFALCSAARFIMVLNPVQTALENAVTPPWFFAIYMPLDIIPTCLIMFFLHKRSVGFRSAIVHPPTTSPQPTPSQQRTPSVNRSERSDANQSMASDPIQYAMGGSGAASGDTLDAHPLLMADDGRSSGSHQGITHTRDVDALLYDRRTDSFDCLGEVDSEGANGLDSSRGSTYSQGTSSEGRLTPDSEYDA